MNPFKFFYWVFYDQWINHSIDEQLEMHRADLILLKIYKKQLNKSIQKNI